MNKQQLIDKAIDDLKLAEEDPFFGKKFLCRTPLADGRFAYYGTDYPHHMADLVCTKHEFQARKAEREAQQHWYDYENKKALRLPPVGEIVQMVTNLDEVRMVAHDSGFAVYWYELFAEYQHTDAYELFRPLDWDKNKNDELHELTLLINSSFITTDPGGIAKAILAAGYRKCDNNNPTTQE